MKSTGLLLTGRGIFSVMHESSARLREARIKAGFQSARAAALRYGWTVSTYSSHENGQTPVPVEAAKTYAPKFKVTAAWILTGDPSVKPASKGESLRRDHGLSRLRCSSFQGRNRVHPLPNVNNLRHSASACGNLRHEGWRRIQPIQLPAGSSTIFSPTRCINAFLV